MSAPSDAQKVTRIVGCPACGKRVKWTSQSRYRPFCSERCKLLDFGAWVDQQHSIPGDGDHQDINSDDLK